jgi:anti-anti-sigma regulatory factor
VETVEQCASELRDVTFAAGDVCALDASATHSMGMVGVQLLLSLHRTLEASGATLILKCASDVMKNAFSDLGCTQQWQAFTAHHRDVLID